MVWSGKLCFWFCVWHRIGGKWLMGNGNTCFITGAKILGRPCEMSWCDSKGVFELAVRCFLLVKTVKWKHDLFFLCHCWVLSLLQCCLINNKFLQLGLQNRKMGGPTYDRNLEPNGIPNPRELACVMLKDGGPFAALAGRLYCHSNIPTASKLALCYAFQLHDFFTFSLTFLSHESMHAIF